MFAEYAAECRSLASEASASVQKLRTAPQDERSALSTAAYGLLRQADASLQSMQMEARSSPELKREEEELRKEMRRLAEELDEVRRDLLLGADSKATEKLFLGREERRRASNATDTLNRSSARLKEASRMAIETETIGIDTLQELRRQREVICGTKDKTAQLDENLESSKSSLKTLENPNCTMM